MAGPVDVPYAVIERMMDDLQEVASGEGTGSAGARFIIHRYRSRTTGKVYDCVFSVGGDTHCAEMPDAETGSPQDAR